MATELLTHAKTGVIQMGWPKLYEAVAFKGNKDDDKSAKKDDKKKNESTPAYGFPVLLDKDDPDHRPNPSEAEQECGSQRHRLEEMGQEGSYRFQ